MRIVLFTVLLFFTAVIPVSANGLPDADRDAVPDKDEVGIYKTDPNKADTDGDGWSDFEEIARGFSPLNPDAVRLDKNDADKDGLNDYLEIQFGTDLANADTDSDGRKDGDELATGNDPKTAGDASLEKTIRIDRKIQRLCRYLGGVKYDCFLVSTGRPGMATPKGDFKIDGKHPRAWSRPYGLWMPYWMSLNHGKFGIHELPEWPNGYKEGADHLGKPVSHGCIRLGIGAAKTVYDWAPIGTKVTID